MNPPVIILHANGTNRDREAAWAIEKAGGAPEIVHVNQLLEGTRRLTNYRMLVLPGGFSYGDDLGAGRLWAVTLAHSLEQDLQQFVQSGWPVLGICNGFQALVKSGLLPGVLLVDGDEDCDEGGGDQQRVTLTRNDSGRFECRWVTLAPQQSPCVFTRNLPEDIYCPVAHGEGKFMARDRPTLAALEQKKLVALRYVAPDRDEAGYPCNPNGSWGDIAGICNPAGNVLGLMPHPEDHIIPRQHPRHHRGHSGGGGLALFENGVRHAAELT